MNGFFPTSRATTDRESYFRSAGDVFTASETRAQLFKRQLAAASAAVDANTARLRALRLEKERRDAEDSAAEPAATKKASRKSARRVTG